MRILKEKRISKIIVMTIISISINSSSNKVLANEIDIKNGWILENNNYYLYSNSNQIKGWYEDGNGRWYWLKPSGQMSSNEWVEVKNKWYRFSESGRMLNSEWYKDGNGRWYWLKPSGQMSSNEWIEVKNKWYRFSESGRMLNSEWYKDEKGTWYWLKENGQMASNETINIKGKTYKFNNTGEMLSEEEVKIEKVVEMAHNQIGKPYKWGASGPDSFDCSGLTSYVYKNAANTKLPRTSREQANVGKTINKNNLKEGDLLFFNTGGYGISHVGLYIGDSKMIHAPSTGKNVKIENINSTYYLNKLVKAKRIL